VTAWQPPKLIFARGRSPTGVHGPAPADSMVTYNYLLNMTIFALRIVTMNLRFPVVCVALLSLTSTVLATEPAGYEQQVLPFFKTYCLHCHDDKQQKGKFRLDTLARDFTDQTIAQRWGEVVFRLNAGEMPPKKEAAAKCSPVILLSRITGIAIALRKLVLPQCQSRCRHE
jgi:hypothetical protein